MKIKILSILILFLFFNKMEAQQSVRVSPIVGLEYHETYSNFQNDNLLFHGLIQKGRWNYRAGLNFNFSLNKSLTIISGVHYYKLGIILKYDESLIPDNIAVFPTGSGPSLVYSKYIKNVRAIPFYLRISKHSEKHFLFVETGMSLNFTDNTTRKRLLTTDSEVISDTIEDREIFVFLKLALGLGYKVSNKLNLAVSPLVRYRPRTYDNFNSANNQHEFTYGMMIKTEIKI